MEVNEITEHIIGAAVKVHSLLGPGLFEQVYKQCLFKELQKQELDVKKELLLPVIYEGEVIELAYRLDLLAESEVIVELKAVDRLLPMHQTQMRTYLKLSRRQVGLLINFNKPTLIQGIVRVVNGYCGARPSAASRVSA